MQNISQYMTLIKWKSYRYVSCSLRNEFESDLGSNEHYLKLSDNRHNDQLPVGLLAQLVECCTGIAEVMGSNPVQAWIYFFQALIFTTACVVSLLQRTLSNSIVSTLACCTLSWSSNDFISLLDDKSFSALTNLCSQICLTEAGKVSCYM